MTRGTIEVNGRAILFVVELLEDGTARGAAWSCVHDWVRGADPIEVVRAPSRREVMAALAVSVDRFLGGWP